MAPLTKSVPGNVKKKTARGNVGKLISNVLCHDLLVSAQPQENLKTVTDKTGWHSGDWLIKLVTTKTKLRTTSNIYRIF